MMPSTTNTSHNDDVTIKTEYLTRHNGQHYYTDITDKHG